MFTGFADVGVLGISCLVLALALVLDLGWRIFFEFFGGGGGFFVVHRVFWGGFIPDDSGDFVKPFEPFGFCAEGELAVLDLVFFI